MKYMHKPTNGKNHLDMVTLGERGQIVIPAAIRERLQLNPGDKLMVFTKHNEVVCLVPASSMRHLVDVLTEQLADLESDQPENPQTNNPKES